MDAADPHKISPRLQRYAILYEITYLLEVIMTLLRPSTDVRPVTEFRAQASAILAQIHETKRPVILTLNGRSSAVLLDVDAYEGLMDELELLRELHVAETQAQAGDVIEHAEVERRLRSRHLP